MKLYFFSCTQLSPHTSQTTAVWMQVSALKVCDLFRDSVHKLLKSWYYIHYIDGVVFGLSLRIIQIKSEDSRSGVMSRSS